MMQESLPSRSRKPTARNRLANSAHPGVGARTAGKGRFEPLARGRGRSMISTGPRGEPIILNGDFLGRGSPGAICGGYAVAKCPSPRPSLPASQGERAYETRLGITGRLAARGGRGRIGAPILNALLPIFANLRPFVRAPHAARPHMLLGVSRKRAMGCRGHEIAQGASRP